MGNIWRRLIGPPARLDVDVDDIDGVDGINGVDGIIDVDGIDDVDGINNEHMVVSY